MSSAARRRHEAILDVGRAVVSAPPGSRRFRRKGARPAKWRRRSTPCADLRFRNIQSNGCQAFAVLGPAFAYFHEQEQMHASFQQPLEFGTRSRTDGFYHPAALAQDDRSVT